MSAITQKEIVMEYYENNPGRDIPHAEVVDWVVAEYKKRTGKAFRDPDRAIRLLHQSGLLIKMEKGVYKYDPNSVREVALQEFTPKQKTAILKRDGYRCVVCGLGEADGVELQVDHIKPKDKGGKAEIINGQTLCSKHNFRKKNYKQTETGKKMFIRLYERAKALDDVKLMDFCKQVLEVYEKNDVNGHIVWNK